MDCYFFSSLVIATTLYVNCIIALTQTNNQNLKWSAKGKNNAQQHLKKPFEKTAFHFAVHFPDSMRQRSTEIKKSFGVMYSEGRPFAKTLAQQKTQFHTNEKSNLNSLQYLKPTAFKQLGRRYTMPPVIIQNKKPTSHNPVTIRRFKTNAVLLGANNTKRRYPPTGKSNVMKTSMYRGLPDTLHKLLLVVKPDKNKVNTLGRNHKQNANKKYAIERPWTSNRLGGMLGIAGAFVPDKRTLWNSKLIQRWDQRIVPPIEELENTPGYTKNMAAAPLNVVTAAVNELGLDNVQAQMIKDENKAIERFMKNEDVQETGTSKSCIENNRDIITTRCGDQIIDHTSHTHPRLGENSWSVHALGSGHAVTGSSFGSTVNTLSNDLRKGPLLVHADGIPNHIKNDISKELSHASDPTNGIMPDTNVQNYQEFDPFRGLNYGVLNQLQDDPAFDEMEYKLGNEPLGLPREHHNIEHDRGSAYHSVIGFHHGGIFHADAEKNGNVGPHGTTDILGGYVSHHKLNGFPGSHDNEDIDYDGDGRGDRLGDLHSQTYSDHHDSNSLEQEAIEHKVAAFSQAIGHPFVASTHSADDGHENNGHFGAGEVYMHQGLFPGSRMHDAVGLEGNHGNQYDHHHSHTYSDHDYDDDTSHHGDNNNNEIHLNEDDHDHLHYTDDDRIHDKDVHHDDTYVIDHHVYHHHHHHPEDHEDAYSRAHEHTYNIGGSIVHAVGDPFAGLEYSFNSPILNHPSGSGLGSLGPLIAAGGGATGGAPLGGGDGQPPHPFQPPASPGGQPPGQNGNGGNPPAGNGSPPAGNGNAPASNGNAPAGNGNPPAGNGNVPAGNGNAPAGNGNPPPGNGNSPTGNGNPPSGNGNPSAGNSEPPAGNGNTPGGSGSPSPGNGNQPAGNGNTPGGNGSPPAGNGGPPAGNGNSSPGNSNQPAGNGNTPGGNVSPPAGNGNPSAGNVGPPAGNGSPSAGSGNQPAGNGNQPAGNGKGNPSTGTANGNSPGGGNGNLPKVNPAGSSPSGGAGNTNPKGQSGNPPAGTNNNSPSGSLSAGGGTNPSTGNANSPSVGSSTPAGSGNENFPESGNGNPSGGGGNPTVGNAGNPPSGTSNAPSSSNENSSGGGGNSPSADTNPNSPNSSNGGGNSAAGGIGGTSDTVGNYPNGGGGSGNPSAGIASGNSLGAKNKPTSAGTNGGNGNSPGGSSNTVGGISNSNPSSGNPSVSGSTNNPTNGDSAPQTDRNEGNTENPAGGTGNGAIMGADGGVGKAGNGGVSGGNGGTSASGAGGGGGAGAGGGGGSVSSGTASGAGAGAGAGAGGAGVGGSTLGGGSSGGATQGGGGSSETVPGMGGGTAGGASSGGSFSGAAGGVGSSSGIGSTSGTSSGSGGTQTAGNGAPVSSLPASNAMSNVGGSMGTAVSSNGPGGPEGSLGNGGAVSSGTTSGSQGAQIGASNSAGGAIGSAGSGSRVGNAASTGGNTIGNGGEGSSTSSGAITNNAMGNNGKFSGGGANNKFSFSNSANGGKIGNSFVGSNNPKIGNGQGTGNNLVTSSNSMSDGRSSGNANQNQNCVCRDQNNNVNKVKRHIVARNCICDVNDGDDDDLNDDDGYELDASDDINNIDTFPRQHRKKKKKKKKLAHNFVNFVEKMAGKLNVDKLNVAEELVQNLKKRKDERSNAMNGVTTIKEANSDGTLDADESSKLKKNNDETSYQDDVMKDISSILTKKQLVEDNIENALDDSVDSDTITDVKSHNFNGFKPIHKIHNRGHTVNGVKKTVIEDR